MTPILCPHCQFSVNVSSDRLGKRGPCPRCGRAILFHPSHTQAELQEQDSRGLAWLQNALQNDPHFSPQSTLTLSRGEEIGRGGMGVVYEVEDTRLKRRAALKLLIAPYETEDCERFMREAILTAALDHPAIPPVYDAGRNANGDYFILMRLISGETLKEASQAQRAGQSGTRTQEELLEALVKVAEAMAHAASRGCVHRDLKPSNIMIGEYGEVLVMDWGLGRRAQDDTEIDSRLLSQWGHLQDELEKSGITYAHSIVGTPGFMSPEQASCEKVDARTDVFGLGATLFYLLTGEAPVQGDNALSKLINTIQGSINNPRDLNPDVSLELDWLTANALATDPNKRTVSAILFAKQLKQYLAGKPIELYPYTFLDKIQHWSKSQFNLLIVLMVLLVTVGGAFVYARQSQKRIELKDTELKASQDRLRLLEAEAQVVRQLNATESAKDAEFLFLEAKQAIRQGQRRSQIIEKIDHALQSSRQTANDTLAAAALYKLAGMSSIYNKTLLKGHSQHPKNLEILFRLHELELAKIVKIEGQFTLTSWFKKLVKLSAENGNESEFTHFMKAQNYMAKKQYARALEAFNRAEQSFQLLHNIYLDRGQCHVFLRQHEAAYADFNKSLSINSKNLATKKQRGDLHFKLKNDEAAIADYKAVLDAVPDDADLYFRLGNVYFRLEQFSLALKAYDQALEHKENLQLKEFSVSNVHTQKALALARTNQTNQAITEFSEAITHDKNNHRRYMNLGRYLEKVGKFSMVAHVYTNAIQKFPEVVTFYRDRARVYKALGRTDERDQDLRSYLKLKPNAKDAAIIRQILNGKER